MNNIFKNTLSFKVLVIFTFISLIFMCGAFTYLIIWMFQKEYSTTLIASLGMLDLFMIAFIILPIVAFIKNHLKKSI